MRMTGRMQLPLRFLSILAFLALWAGAAALADSTEVPGPAAVLDFLVKEAASGELLYHLTVTLARVAGAFFIAMFIGTALGVLMGQSHSLNRTLDPWVILLLNLPALVVIVLCYIWIGLTEAAAITAVAINKIPNVVVTLREGARALDPRAHAAPRGAAAAAALHRRRRALRPGADLEDRAGGGTAGALQRGRLPDPPLLPALRRGGHSRLCPGFRLRHAVHRISSGPAS
jgi:ABC-type nitrate/sulfonate/bicarbonate transport system permease component